MEYKLKAKYRLPKTPKTTAFKPKYERDNRRKSAKYQKFCRAHPKSRA